MIQIAVTSKNPVKIDAAREGFKKMFPQEELSIVPIAVPSNVSDQPMTEEETLKGAIQRVDNSLSQIDADYYVGIEGGLEEKEGHMHCFAWIVIKSKAGKIGKAKTSTFILPDKVMELIHQGKELGEADDIVFGYTNSKQQMGSIGILTKNIITRAEYYREAVVLALIPFKNEELY